MKHQAIVVAHEAIITIERVIIALDGRRHVVIDERRMNAGLVDNDELPRLDNALAMAVKITAKLPNGKIIAHYER